MVPLQSLPPIAPRVSKDRVVYLIALFALATAISLIAQRIGPDPLVVKLVMLALVAALLLTIPVTMLFRLRRNGHHLKKIAQVDGVTGVTNQQTFLHRFERALPQSGVLLMLDFDHFKRVSAVNGSHSADLCLMALAQRCREITRTTDIVGRLDDAVFGIYLPGAPIERGRHVADELSKGVHVVPPNGIVYASVSVGMVIADGWTSQDKLMRSVEQALDLAKLRGPAHVMMRPVVPA
ncbi:MAG: GGDEF domain-containing protein [Pseudomonadota bacterium]